MHKPDRRSWISLLEHVVGGRAKYLGLIFFMAYATFLIVRQRRSQGDAADAAQKRCSASCLQPGSRILNTLSILDFVVAVDAGFACEAPAQCPLAVVPGLLVPFALFMHFGSWRKLRGLSRVAPAPVVSDAWKGEQAQA